MPIESEAQGTTGLESFLKLLYVRIPPPTEEQKFRSLDKFEISKNALLEVSIYLAVYNNCERLFNRKKLRRSFEVKNYFGFMFKDTRDSDFWIRKIV